MCGDDEKKGKVVIISGPSGVGKSTICLELVKQIGAFLSVSVTTRPQAESEVNGKDYWFLSQEEFQKRLEAGGFLSMLKSSGISTVHRERMSSMLWRKAKPLFLKSTSRALWPLRVRTPMR